MPDWLVSLLQWLAMPEAGLGALFVVSLLSATLLPVGSEAALFGLLKLNPDLFWKLVIPIGLCSAATVAEVFRAGVLALPAGQAEAGAAIGLTPSQIFRLIEFPQALRMVVPSLVAQVVILLKDTTLGYVVSYSELQHSARVLVASTGHLIQTYLIVAVVFVAINIGISSFARQLDVWTRTRRRARADTASLAPAGSIA